MNKTWKIVTIVITIILMLFVGLGIKIHMDNVQFHKEMVAIVKSDEAQKVIKRYVIKSMDPKALTEEGKIKSYTIDYEDGISHNPMGGIDVEAFVNNDKHLYFSFNLDKPNIDGQKPRLNIGSSSESSELDDILRGE